MTKDIIPRFLLHYQFGCIIFLVLSACQVHKINTPPRKHTSIKIFSIISRHHPACCNYFILL